MLAGQRVNLEFVSANPTGPLHAGGGRWVAVGDAIANLLAAQGAEVHREYYLNDAGTQLDMFRASLYARYRGEEPPEDGYQGEYLVDMAARAARRARRRRRSPTTRASGATDEIVAGLQDDLGRIGVHFDTWFSERTCTSAAMSPTCSRDLDERGRHVRRGRRDAGCARPTSATSAIVCSSAATAPRPISANDLAYHRDKFARGFTHLIDIWGADHHGQVKSLQAGHAGAGLPGRRARDHARSVREAHRRTASEVRMSKRAGNIITLADILDEVDPDVARMTFLLQGIDSPQTFDLDIVTAQSMENPVYYVQYAHARIASIGRKAAAAGVTRRPLDDGRPLAARARTRGGAAARARAVSRRRRTRPPRARAPQKVTHVGARLRRAPSTASTATAACSPTMPS